MISKDLKKRIYTSAILLILIFISLKINLILVFSLIVLGVMSIIEFLSMIKKIIKNKFYLFISSFVFSIYVFIFCILFFILLNFIPLKIILISLLLGCAASDIGGFVFGKIFKGPKLTSISPNKTISGSLGSIVFTILTLAGFVFIFTKNFSYIILFVAITTSIACQLGDLFFSLLKRKAKIKDTGNFFPGHGGVLDRLDSIFLGLPVGFTSIFLFY
jgi:phosphatidate cytidylyltransferase